MVVSMWIHDAPLKDAKDSRSPTERVRASQSKEVAVTRDFVTKTVTNSDGEPRATEGTVTNSVTKLRGTEGNEINKFGAISSAIQGTEGNVGGGS